MPVVYVVDDFQNVVSAVMRELRHLGAEVVGFTDPKQALARVDAQPPDVLVTDLLMPGMNGLELAERIRARQSTLATILISTTEPEMLERIAERVPIAGQVHKPWEPGSIAALVQSALGAHGNAR